MNYLAKNRTGIIYRRQLATAPSVEPVSLADMKTWLYVYGNDHDKMINELITTARQKIETDYDVALIDQTWDFYLDEFPVYDKWLNKEHVIEPSLYPLSSVTSITYTDTAGASQTWASSNYFLDTPNNQPHRILLTYNADYPEARQIQNSVVVRVVAGYGSAATDVPSPIKTAIKMMVKAWYDQPEDINRSSAVMLPWNTTAQNLLRNYFTWRV